MTARGVSPLRLAALGALALNAACVLTSTPQFTSEEHTAPFLLDETANPKASQVLQIDLAAPMDPETFSADVVSQDDPTGSFSSVSSYLYIDLNSGLPGEPPYSSVIPGSVLSEPGSLTDPTPRPLLANWHVETEDVPSLGCHTATLAAAHNFDHSTACPCPGDSTQITWQLLVCDSTKSPTSCEDLMLAGCPSDTATNPNAANNCQIYIDAVDGDAGTTCPADTAAIPIAESP
jgi:hypothetical protein